MVEKLTTKKYNLRAKFGPEEYEDKASKLDMASNQKRLDRNLIVARGARVIINQNINTFDKQDSTRKKLFFES